SLGSLCLGLPFADRRSRPPSPQASAFLRHPPWPLRARLLVAEAEQEQRSARLQDGRQALDVAPPALVGENVELAVSPVHHPASSREPVIRSATSRKGFCGLPMSHGACPAYMASKVVRSGTVVMVVPPSGHLTPCAAHHRAGRAGTSCTRRRRSPHQTRPAAESGSPGSLAVPPGNRPRSPPPRGLPPPPTPHPPPPSSP